MPETRSIAAALIFLLTYLVIGLQRIPRLHLGRPAGALLGAVAMVAVGVLDFDAARRAVDLDTILFLLGMMIVLAYLEMSGFFEAIERRIVGYATTARALLVLVMVSSGVLSAMFMNDTICLMLTPVVLRVAKRLGLFPVPYLVGLAVAANVGSVCTIVGNPQNAMIGVRSEIRPLDFTMALWPVSALGLLLSIAAVSWVYRREVSAAPIVVPPPREPYRIEPWLLAASLLSGIGMMIALAAGARPAAAAMTAAAAVIVAGATRPRQPLQRVDWSLLLFFGGLFVVMRAVEQAGLAGMLARGAASHLAGGSGVALVWLGLATTFVSQAVSNVPAVMLFLPLLEGLPPASAHPLWLGLAAFSTLAGNLTIIGSVANVIVFETARREGVEIGFFEYLRAGLPVTLGTLVLAWAVLAF